MHTLLMACVLLGTMLAGNTWAATAPEPITVFAAASLKESMDEAAATYERATGQSVRVSYAASSALARQIQNGAPADVFVSADLEWMDWLQRASLIDVRSRRVLLRNTLVLVAPATSHAASLSLQRGTDLKAVLGNGRIALALTDSVPAGKYARAAFVSLGLWPQLQGRMAEVENVRAALLLVARGETPLGVVYASDAQAEPRVRVLATFPAATHPPIVYPVARVAASRQPQADAFIHWLRSARAQAIFRRHGFIGN